MLLFPVVAVRTGDLACELVRVHIRFVVVGSTARWLRGDRTVMPGDLDIVVDNVEVPRLRDALGSLGVAVRRDLSQGRVATGWGPLDVFVATRPPSTWVHVGGVAVAVAR